MAQNTEVIQVNVDGFLAHVGEYGKRQLILQAIFSVMVFIPAYQGFAGTFLGLNPPWRCTGLSNECNHTTSLSFDIGDDFYEQRCSMKNRSSWEFVQPKRYSIVTEWDLVCDRKELSYLANSVVYIGAAFGIIFLMAASDRYGRKMLLFFSVAGTILFGFASSIAHEFWLLCLFRLLLGAVCGGISTTIFIILCELVGPKYRAFASSSIWFFYTLALCLLGLQAWLIPEWKKLGIIITIPYIFVLGFWKLVPESVRWLRVNGRHEEAEKTLFETVKMNGWDMPNIKLSRAENERNHGTYIQLFRNWTMCKSTLVQSFLWFANGMVYYGITMASENLGGNMYRDFVLSSLVELPANVFVIVLGNRLGRKSTTIASMVLSGISCGVIGFIPDDATISAYTWSRVALGMMGKLCITLSYGEIYVWSTELFPTVVRAQGIGVVVVASTFGASAAPWVAQWLTHIATRLPFFVMGGLAITAAVLSFALPETKGVETAEELPHSIIRGDERMKDLTLQSRTKPEKTEIGIESFKENAPDASTHL